MNNNEWSNFALEWDKYMQNGDWFQRYIIYPVIIKKLGDISGKKIIDIGCGNGHISRLLNNYNAIVTGVDCSNSMIQICKSYNDAIEYLNVDITKDKLNNEYYDIAIFSNSLHCIYEYEIAIQNAYNILNSNGQLLIIIKHPCFHPNNSNLGWTLQFEDGHEQNTGYGLNSLISENKKFLGLYYKMDDYFSKTSYSRSWFQNSTITYTRTIEDYVMTVISSDFDLLGIFEPKPIVQAYDEQPHLYDLLQRIPHFLVIHAKKH